MPDKYYLSMTHEEAVQEIIKHADVIVKMYPFCLLTESDVYYMDKAGHIGNKKNIYEVDGVISNY